MQILWQWMILLHWTEIVKLRDMLLHLVLPSKDYDKAVSIISDLENRYKN
jgi:hypothetical protein